MAIDDIRALILLAQHPGLYIEAIVTSDGSSDPEVGARNACHLMSALGEEDIAIGYGRALGLPAPPWRTLTAAPALGGFPPCNASLSTARDLLQSALSERRSIYICLGPMTNLADLISASPELTDNIIEIWYRGLPPAGHGNSWNTSRDITSAIRVFSWKIPIYAFSLPDSLEPVFDSALLARIKNVNTPVARLLCGLHDSEALAPLVQAGHFHIWDEDLIISKLYPVSAYEPNENTPIVKLATSFDSQAALGYYIQLLNNDHRSPRMPIVFDEFPSQPSIYKPDIAAIAESAQARYGLEEWNTIVLTSEMHGHMGIYALIGAKMGLRARDILGVGLDKLTVESCAGQTTPLSCLNDGLQVSTGATFGHGNISLVGKPYQPKAIFHSADRRIALSLREDIARQIEKDIADAINRNGGVNDAYFAEVRALALRYWLEIDRKNAFLVLPVESQTNK
jgi:pyrimidine-specific ribonucleoside hydrolase